MSAPERNPAGSERAARNRGRRILLVLAVLFIGPLAVAWFLYFGGGAWRPAGSAAHGELIEPPVALPVAPDGAGPVFRDVWSLTVVAPGACDASCVEALIRTQRVRLSLGRRMDRVVRVLVVGAPGDTARTLADEDRELRIIDAGTDEAAALLDRFPGAADSGEWVYLVDPLGNLMMRFDGSADLVSIQKDLKRLLKLSRIG